MIERYSDTRRMSGRSWRGCAPRSPSWRSGFWEKFDLFLRIASASLATRAMGSQAVGNIAGLMLIALGGTMMIFAVLRFCKTALDIDAAEVRAGPRDRLDLTLLALLVLLGTALLVYLAYTVLSH